MLKVLSVLQSKDYDIMINKENIIIPYIITYNRIRADSYDNRFISLFINILYVNGFTPKTEGFGRLYRDQMLWNIIKIIFNKKVL